MKLCNLIIDGECRLGLVTARGVIDASGTGLSMDAVIGKANCRNPLKCWRGISAS